MINYNVSIDSLCVGGIVVSSNEIIKSITTEVLIKKYGINLDSKYMNEISNNYLINNFPNKENLCEDLSMMISSEVKMDIVFNLVEQYNSIIVKLLLLLQWLTT